MAIVPDIGASNIPLPGSNSTTDLRFTMPNRVIAGNPSGVFTPQYTGEIVLDTSSAMLWRASGVASNSWVPAVVEA